MKNMSSLLASSSSFGVGFAIVFTAIVVLMFVAIIVMLWWVDVKKKPLASLFKAIGRGIYNAFDKVYDFFTSGSTVKTVYSDKSLNYSGTEFLPVPTKAPTDKYTYEFVGWDKNAVDQNGNFVVRAIYLQRVIKCYINVYDDDKATLLKSFVVEYGAGVNLADLKPKKAETKEFSYEFVGWDKDINSFYGNTNVCAVYKAIPKKYSYTFFDEDGKTVISQGNAIYGTPIIAPSNPQKESTDKAYYEFVGWKNYSEGMLLTKDASFTAIYEKRVVDSDVQTSVIKADGTIIRAKKQPQPQTNQNVSILPKRETKTNSFELDKDEILHGSVGAQIASIKKQESKDTQTAYNAENSEPKVIVPSESEEVHQKIQLVTSKEAVKIEEKQTEENPAEAEDKVEEKVLKNMVVNRVKINKKK